MQYYFSDDIICYDIYKLHWNVILVTYCPAIFLSYFFEREVGAYIKYLFILFITWARIYTYSILYLTEILIKKQITINIRYCSLRITYRTTRNKFIKIGTSLMLYYIIAIKN